MHGDIICLVKWVSVCNSTPQIINEGPNLAFQVKFIHGNSHEYLQNSNMVFEDNGETPKIHHGALEPHACMSEIDENNNIVVYTPCQDVFQCQYHISKILQIPMGKVRIIKAHMGGSFGGKCQTILEPITAYAAYKLRRPVKLLMNRKESIIASRTRNATAISVKTTVTKEGKLLARSIIANIDGGAYYTNTTPGGACRRYGSPQLHAITEINIDNIANKLGIDPVEFRLLNLVDPGTNDPLGGSDIGNAQIKECVVQGAKEFEWKKRRANIKSKNTDRYRYGVGMACATHRNGCKGGSPDFSDVNISVLPDGYINLKIGVHEQGCGTIHTLKQIVAEELDIPLHKIILGEADTFISPYDSAGSHASRVTYVCGGAVKKAAAALKKRLIDFYCDLKCCTEKDVILCDGYISLNSYTEERLSYGAAAVLMEKKYSQSMSEFIRYESPGNPASYSACFVEVKVDTYTGHVKINDMLILHDIGKAIDPALVRGQILGGAHMSIGMALREEIIVDNNGYILNDDLSKYHIINASEMPDIKVILIEEIEPSGPYGAKSVGELSAVVPAPAILNAINYALGTNITKYPVKPEVVMQNHLLRNQS